MKITPAVIVSCVWLLCSTCHAQQMPAEAESTPLSGPSDVRVETMVRIVGVEGDMLYLSISGGFGSRGGMSQMNGGGQPGGQSESPGSGRGRRGRGMRGGASGQMEDGQPQSGGRGRRGARFRAQSEDSGAGGGADVRNQFTAVQLTDDILLTFATQERRTGDFLQGTEINGRLQNEVFRNIQASGLSARVVSVGNRVIEINVMQANDTSTAPIAVKPKRPPMLRQRR